MEAFYLSHFVTPV